MNKKEIETPMPIITPRLKIFPPHPDFAERVYKGKMESLESLKPWLVWTIEDQGTIETMRSTLAKKYHKFLEREEFMMLAFTQQGDFVATAGIQNIDWDIPMAEIGYWTVELARGKGYMTEVVNALVRYSFDVLKMRKVSIGMDSENAASEAIPKRLNMIKEFEAAGMIKTLHSKDGPLRIRRSYCCFDTNALPPLEVSWG